MVLILKDQMNACALFDNVRPTPFYLNIGDEAPPRYIYAQNWKIRSNPRFNVSLYNSGTDQRTASLEEVLCDFDEGSDLISVKDLTCIFQKCKNMKCSACSDRAFLLVCGNGLDAYGLLGNYIVPMFVECGNLPKARQVLWKLIDRDEYSWTSLIKGYIDSGDFYYGLDLYKSMQEDLVDASGFTFVALLKACAQLRLFDVGLKFHIMIIEEEYEKDPFIGNSLIYMYAKCGLFAEAQHIFYHIIDRDVVSWNALIAGYPDPFLFSVETSFLDQMLLEEVCPNAITYACSLKACGDVNAVERGQEIHIHASKTGFEGDPYVGNTLVDVYCKWSLLEEACKVFNDLPTQNTVSWNALIVGYVENGNNKEALHCFQEMHLDGVLRDTVTFVFGLKACSNIGIMTINLEMHSIIVKVGHEKDSFVANALVDMYAKHGLFEESLLIIVKLPTNDAIPWNALISGYIDHGLDQEALKCIEEMQIRDIPQDVATFIYGLKACGNLGFIERGLELHTWISKLKIETDILIGNALLAMYVKWGSTSEAQQLFDVLPIQDVISWNTLIAGYSEHGQSEKAIAIFEKMEQRGVVSDAFSYVSILKACGNLCAKGKGQEIHIEIMKKETENYVIGISLIEMYAKCGSLTEAQETFNRLDTQDSAAWTALINGYIENGYFEEVTDCVEEMQLRGVSPNATIFGLSFKACGFLRSIKRIQQLYADAAKQGLENESFVINMLIGSLVKCGLSFEAIKIFEHLPVYNVLSWNIMLSAYADHGFDEELPVLSDRMKLQGILPNAITFVYCLKGCAHTGDIDRGQKVHDQLVQLGIDKDPFIGTSLIDMYAKCGFLSESQEVFDQLPVQDVVSWNALIAGYIDNGLSDKALIWLDKMQENLVPFDAITCISWLCICVDEKDIQNGHEIYGEVIKKGFENEILITNALLNMYVKCGSFVEARHVFDGLSIRCNSSWNALICGYAEYGLNNELFECLELMQVEGFTLNDTTYVCSLKACSELGEIEIGKKLHVGIAKSGFDAFLHVGNTLIHMYAKCHSFVEAWRVLESLSSRDVVSWNAMIIGYVEQGFYNEALGCLQYMQLDDVLPNVVTYICTLKLCVGVGSLMNGIDIHLSVCKTGLDRDLIVGTALVDMYAKFGFLKEAQRVFDRLYVRDIVLWNSLIAGYSEYGFKLQALSCLEHMEMEGVSPNTISWNTIILGLINHGESQKGLFLYDQMQERGLLPDTPIFTSLLKACGNDGALESGRKIHSQISKLGLDLIEPCMSTALVNMYAKCGCMNNAKHVFDMIPMKDLHKWTALIMGYARHGDSGIVVHLFERMLDEGIHPNEVTFLNIISLCTHTGLVDKGLIYFDAMQNGYGILPSAKHLNCVVDLLSRAGHIEEAFFMVENMHSLANIVTWTILLAACKKWACLEHWRPRFELIKIRDEWHITSCESVSDITITEGYIDI